MSDLPKIVLPCLKGRIGDWYYYLSLLPFEEVAQRVSLTDEIHSNKQLSDWIQRQLTGSRIADIVSYLENQPQRFFNAIILGIYGGEPYWQEIDIMNSIGAKRDEKIQEEQIDYLSRTVGILTLSGTEKLFAMDGQHRVKAIKMAVKAKPSLKEEEVAIIFVAHKQTKDGRVRTRRLFSTLNRYAKPVNTSEIIALDEEDNAAILTRQLIEESKLLRGKILFSRSRSISPANTDAFTNVLLLYDLIKILLTDKPILRIKVDGTTHKQFLTTRETEKNLKRNFEVLEATFQELFNRIPPLKDFMLEGKINRSRKQASLLFRPIGQIVFFSVLKVAMSRALKEKAIRFFASHDFSLRNTIWSKVFWDEDTQTIRTEKNLQRYAIGLLLKRLNVEFNEGKKEREIFESFGVDPKSL